MRGRFIIEKFSIFKRVEYGGKLLFDKEFFEINIQEKEDFFNNGLNFLNHEIIFFYTFKFEIFIKDDWIIREFKIVFNE